MRGMAWLGTAGDGALAAARQAAALFVLGAVLALASSLLPDGRPAAAFAIAAADLLAAALVWYLPWAAWRANSTLAIAVPALGIVGLACWAAGDTGLDTPFIVLIYVWVGLHHPPWAVLALAPAATVAYVLPLLLTHRPADVVASGVVFIPVVTAVGLIVANRIRYLQEAREHLRRMEKWRASMIMTLAHDVRSPLTTVQATLELLAEDDGAMAGPDRRTLTSAALRQTARITRLSSGLLDLERIDKGMLRLDLRAVCLRDAAEQAVGFINAAGVVILVDADTWVRADPERLQQILVNLTTNALRHGKPPVVIDAEVPPDDAGQPLVRLRVRDHGAGVPPDDRARLFQQFGGVDRTAESVGLGLWIVRQLTRAHGGDVGYEPADPGARFVVTLPAARPLPPTPADLGMAAPDRLDSPLRD